MKIIAYLRVSTGGQELSNQRLAILDYAQHHHLHIDRFLEIQVSSRKSLKERGIDGLFAGMQAGDLLLVSELSRLGRSVGQVIQIVDDSKRWSGKVVTTLEPFEKFWPAEPEHQDYLLRIPNGYTCHFERFGTFL